MTYFPELPTKTENKHKKPQHTVNGLVSVPRFETGTFHKESLSVNICSCHWYNSDFGIYKIKEYNLKLRKQ